MNTPYNPPGSGAVGDSAPPQDHDPADANAVLRDDVLVDALAKGVLPMEHADDPLVHLLLTQRQDVHSVPLSPALADLTVEGLLARQTESSASEGTGYVEAPTQMLAPLRQVRDITLPSSSNSNARKTPGAVPAALPPRKPDGTKRPASRPRARSTTSTRVAQTPWMRRPLMLASVVIAMMLGSLGGLAAARTAEPGSIFFPITKVVNAERADSLEAREAAFGQLQQARQLADKNDLEQARQHLQEALSKAEDVRPQEKGKLENELKAVEKKIDQVETTPSPTPSGSPSGSPTESGTPSTTPSGTSPSPTGTATTTSAAAGTPTP